MNIKEELEDIQNKVKEQSWAYEILQDYKKANKRMFIIILVLIGCLIGSIGYTVYLLNDIEYVDTTYTQEVEDIDTINGNVVNKGDVYGESKTDN